MNNQKTIFAAMQCLLVYALFFIACGKDSPTKPNDDQMLVGSWDVSKMISEYGGEIDTLTASQLDSMGLVWTLKMNEDGTAEQTTNLSGPLLTFPGTWSVSANKLTLNLIGPNGENGKMVYEFAVDGNILKLSWELLAGAKLYAEFTKQ